MCQWIISQQLFSWLFIRVEGKQFFIIFEVVHIVASNSADNFNGRNSWNNAFPCLRLAWSEFLHNSSTPLLRRIFDFGSKIKLIALATLAVEENDGFGRGVVDAD